MDNLLTNIYWCEFCSTNDPNTHKWQLVLFSKNKYTQNRRILEKYDAHLTPNNSPEILVTDRTSSDKIWILVSAKQIQKQQATAVTCLMKWRSLDSDLSLRIHLVCTDWAPSVWTVFHPEIVCHCNLQLATLLLVGKKVLLSRNKSINCQLAIYIQIVHSSSSSTGTVPLQLYIAKWKNPSKLLVFIHTRDL
jgi:hypothetical protein